jgi:DNA primase
VLPGGDGPKYKNSQETPIYSKRKVLYGLNWAKDEVVRQGEVVVCEGYTDVIGMSRAGVRRAVATCGTALGEEHVRLLKGFASRVVLAFDADSAGQAAAQRLYAWEQKEQVDFAVAGFPVGTDPGDLARTDPDALRRAVEEARPFLAFRIERELGAADLRSPEGRARAAAAAMSAIAEHPNELVRDQYVREVADRCQVDPDKLRALGARTPAAPSSRPAPRRRRADPPSPETEALRLAVHVPEKMADKLEEVLFHDELHLAAFRALAAADTLHGAIAAADPGAGELLQRLAVEDTEADPDDVATLLVRAAARRAVAQLETQARSAPERAVELAPTIGWLTSEVQRLEDHRTRLEAGGRLVAWLLGRVEEDA